MTRYAVAGALLLIGLAASGRVAVSEPRNDDCVNCAPSNPYDTQSPARIRQEMDRPRSPYAGSPVQSETGVPSDRTSDATARQCTDCPPPKHYDSVEVVKSSRDVDQSRVINTESVVHLRPRVKEINKLVIHENETRNVGVIQHNHRIIDKEIRYVTRKQVYRYAPSYQVVQRVQTVLVPVVVQPPQPCGCPCTCSGGLFGALSQARTYDDYAYVTGQPAVQQVLVPVSGPAGYGYR